MQTVFNLPGTPSCNRVGGCLKEKTKNWVRPEQCSCEILAILNKAQVERDNGIALRKHLSDIAFVNQNGRGK